MGTALTSSQMKQKVEELERENQRLDGQRATVVAVNPTNGAFEYIGSALELPKEKH